MISVLLLAAAGSCAAPNRDVMVTEPAPPRFDSSAADAKTGGAVEVRVTVGNDGKVVKEEITRSSGSKTLDGAAVRAARETKYVPKLVNCVPQAGTFLFRLTFAPKG